MLAGIKFLSDTKSIFLTLFVHISTSCNVLKVSPWSSLLETCYVVRTIALLLSYDIIQVLGLLWVSLFDLDLLVLHIFLETTPHTSLRHNSPFSIFYCTKVQFSCNQCDLNSLLTATMKRHMRVHIFPATRAYKPAPLLFPSSIAQLLSTLLTLAPLSVLLCVQTAVSHRATHDNTSWAGEEEQCCHIGFHTKPGPSCFAQSVLAKCFRMSLRTSSKSWRMR